jgi:hypothetical protein
MRLVLAIGRISGGPMVSAEQQDFRDVMAKLIKPLGLGISMYVPEWPSSSDSLARAKTSLSTATSDTSAAPASLNRSTQLGAKSSHQKKYDHREL